ncbi:NADPH-dependent oxidoreductase [Nocardia yunnanensis]|uniref:NADPH-dependent oxidoreductase n=1 Tax=Nocardia yunnanensis TaxID=2382165 RepID=A0A386ZQZ7_9NOCA|nr:NADPH-dependent oxidoreductase [Nocardia yunnanensis]AYF79510.1 NADPH-dependent oxidoreductase [Nocardia yunnanensis]
MTQIASSPQQVVARRYRDPESVPPAEWNPVLQVLHEHRSVRRYLPDPIPDAIVRLLVSAAQSAPTSSNLQAWSVIAVREPERKARLAVLAGGQEHITQAPLLLVWTADLARARTLAAGREVPLDGADYLESSFVAFLDAALAAQNAVVAAESLGYGTVYIGAIRNHPEQVSAELGLPAGVFPVVGLVVGRPDPAENTRVKPRLPQAAVLHAETYDPTGQAKPIADYEDRIAEFYAEQDLTHSWIDRVLTRLGSVAALNGRHRLRDQLTAHGFPLK